MRTIAEINEKISRKRAVVWTVEELKARVIEIGVTKTTKEVDVITTGTFEPMESSGAIINLGHTDPPIKIRRCWLDGVPAYAGLGQWIYTWVLVVPLIPQMEKKCGNMVVVM